MAESEGLLAALTPSGPTASSFLGCVTTVTGASFGWLVGQSFDGTRVPLSIGFVTLSVR